MSYKAFENIKQHVEIEMLKKMSFEEINNILNKQHEKIQQLEKVRDAANVALSHMTGGMDGDWRDCDPVELLRDALRSYQID